MKLCGRHFLQAVKFHIELTRFNVKLRIIVICHLGE